MSLSKVPFCVVCLKTEGEDGIKVLLCGGCNIVPYCSRPCQLADIKNHRVTCKALQYYDKVAMGKKTSNQVTEAATDLTIYSFLLQRKGLHEDKRLIGRAFWLATVLRLGMNLKLYGALKIAVDNMPTLWQQFRSIGNADVVCFYLELDRLQDAMNMMDKALSEVALDGPEVLISRVTLFLFTLNMINEREPSYNAFMELLAQAPEGLPAKKLLGESRVVKLLQRMIFGPAHREWKSKWGEGKLREILEDFKLKDPGFLRALIDPKTLDYPLFQDNILLPRPFANDDMDYAKFGARVIQRIPFAVEYITNFINN